MIIIVSSDQRAARTAKEMLYYMGVLSTVATPDNIEAHLEKEYTAALIISQEEKTGEDRLTDKLRPWHIPVYYLSEKKGEKSSAGYPVAIWDVFSDMIRDAIRGGGTPPGIYRLGEIDASCTAGCVSCGGEELPLTKTERMILAYLIKSYPKSRRSREILTAAFKCGRLPEVSSVRTHLCSINKKTKRVLGEALIYSTEDGYRLKEYSQISQKEKNRA